MQKKGNNNNSNNKNNNAKGTSGKGRSEDVDVGLSKHLELRKRVVLDKSNEGA